MHSLWKGAPWLPASAAAGCQPPGLMFPRLGLPPHHDQEHSRAVAWVSLGFHRPQEKEAWRWLVGSNDRSSVRRIKGLICLKISCLLTVF